MHRSITQSARRFATTTHQTPASSSRLSIKPVSASFSTSSLRPAHSDYGSGDAPKGPNPSEGMEHPGPPAPDVGGSGSNSSSGSDSSSFLGSGKAQPRLNQKDGDVNEEQVKKHNEEMDQRPEKSHNSADFQNEGEKVEKGFWKGEGDQ